LSGFWQLWPKSENFYRNPMTLSDSGIPVQTEFLPFLSGFKTDVAGFHFMPLVIFSYEPNAKKYFSGNYFFLKNDFVENILQRKNILRRNKRSISEKSYFYDFLPIK